MVCHYEPRGNFVGSSGLPGAPVYDEGEPCSKCGGKKCKDDLCTEEGDEVTKKPIGDGVSQTVTCDGALRVMSQLDS